MSNQDQAVETAKKLFVPELIEFVGQGFYRYAEPITEEMISRKGLEREASTFYGVPLTLITRHDVEDSRQVFPTERVSILQLTSAYEADQAKALEAKAKKLQNKYSHK